MWQRLPAAKPSLLVPPTAEPEPWRPSIMPQHRNENHFVLNFEHQMIGKASNLTPPPFRIERVATIRRLLDSCDRIPESFIQTVSCRVRTCVVIFKRQLEIAPDQEVKDDRHRARSLSRSARNSAMNSASGIPSSLPAFNSSPLRIASVRLSSSESFGSAPSKLSMIRCINSARSDSSSFIASAPISETFIREFYPKHPASQALDYVGRAKRRHRLASHQSSTSSQHQLPPDAESPTTIRTTQISRHFARFSCS
jgi:hypothetical protein